MSFLFGKVGIFLALILVALFFVWGIARNWSCRQQRERPDHVATFTVAHVQAGNRILVETGFRGRKTRAVVLHGIGTPTEGPLVEESRKNLETLAGKTIRAGIHQGHERGSGEIDAVVCGEHGAICQIEQLQAGLAWVTDTKQSAWLKAETEARKGQRGIWAKPKATNEEDEDLKQ